MGSSVFSRPRAGFSGLLRACLLLLIVLSVLGLFAGSYKYYRIGWPGVAATCAAGGICWLGGTLALALAAWSGSAAVAEKGRDSKGHASLWALLGGMVFRMLLPLAGGLMLDRQVPALAGTGVFEQVLIFYLLMLVVETWLSLGLLGAAKQAS